ncbi:hypothetical protein AT6N2_C3320 [Agrobacterium tumefaciens]|nr:hypothetical protein AT6N2_C3320 [Agrobacterium tumefaciens]
MALKMGGLVFVAMPGFGGKKRLKQLGCHKGRYDGGTLVPDAAAADGQDEFGEAAIRLALPLQPMGKGGALGLRTDHADIGKILAGERFLRDEEIECVVVSDDDHCAMSRNFRNECFRHGGEYGHHCRRKIAQLVFTGLDHGQGQWQQRQGFGQRLAHMAGAKNEDGRLLLSFAFQPCLKRRRDLRRDQPEADEGAAAAALADFRAERNIHVILGSTAAQHGAGVVYRHIFELAAADGFPDGLLGDQHEGASLARRRAFHGFDFHEYCGGGAGEERG